MARIRLRPHDLALLAQRLDATSDELRRSARRLEAESTEVVLNPLDDGFSAGRFSNRSAVVQARFRQLADEVGVDGGLLSSAAYGGEFDQDGQWLQSLQVALSGWGSATTLGSACTDVARGLASIVGSIVSPRRSGLTNNATADHTAEAGHSAAQFGSKVMVDDRASDQYGGLFVTVSSGGNGDVAYLGGFLGRVARDENPVEPAPHEAGSTSPDSTTGGETNEPDWSRVWAGIDNDLDSNSNSKSN